MKKSNIERERVTVYEDPVANQKPEGSAVVMRVLYRDEDFGRRAIVRFDNGDTCERWIE